MDENLRKYDFNIDGSFVVITGGTSGIGRETAVKLSRAGAYVLITGRDRQRLDEAKQDIDMRSGNPVRTLPLDLSSFESIYSFSEKLVDVHGTPDVLINNAGIYTRGYKKSVEGFEMTMAVNYLGPFYLTRLLLPHMMDIDGEARIINVTSDSYHAVKFNPDIFTNKRESGFCAYSKSKRALMYFNFILAGQLRDTNITVNCVHPGHSATGIWPSDPWYWRLAGKMISITADPPAYAADNIVYAASSEELTGVTGRYIKDMAISRVRKRAFNDGDGKKLWNNTIELLNKRRHSGIPV
ncbi:MAG: SDR family NAD(P)-dependent oxidoreductase [Clostridia bacterium]|nr:SDR family NAD(P)-dependent oxidoreductase [Clostridia bacterium]